MQNNWITTKRKGYIGLMRGLMALSTALTCGIALFLIGYVLIKGLPSITWELLSTKPSYLAGTIGILPDILNTVYIIVATLLIVLPLGVGAASRQEPKLLAKISIPTSPKIMDGMPDRVSAAYSMTVTNLWLEAYSVR